MNEELAQRAFEHALQTYEQDFETFFLARLLGFEFSYPDGSCTVEMDVKDFMFNPQGGLHGGITTLIMDVSMGHLIRRELGAAATLEMKTQFLRPIREGRIRVTGSFVQKGRSIQFMKSELRNPDGELAAFASSTWKVLSRRAQSPSASDVPPKSSGTAGAS